jgi:DNA-binding Lrp family transcriptional regulator
MNSWRRISRASRFAGRYARIVAVVLDPLDGNILHAIQLSPRVPFRRIADVVGAPEQMVARRYRKLNRDGVIRVVGLVNPSVHGESQWIVRVRAKPHDLPGLAEALIRRPEVTHANALSGGTELVCVIRAPLGDSSDGLLQRLPRTSKVLGLDIALVLHTFGDATSAHWTAYGHGLDAAAAEGLREPIEPLPGPPAAPHPDDRVLFDALAEDGRVPHARLAELTGWSPARVKRRLAALASSGTLTFDVDMLPERLGFGVNAVLWLTAAPSHVAAIGERVADHPEIASVSAITGRDNLMAVAICRDVDHLYRYLTQRLSTVEGIRGYDVSIRSQRLKQAASLIAHGRLVRPS